MHPSCLLQRCGALHSSIYRVVTVARAGGGLKDYRHVLEVLVESSALWSISLILYIAFLARNVISSIYFEFPAAFARVDPHSFSVFTSNKHHTGSCSNNPCWGASQQVTLAQTTLGRAVSYQASLHFGGAFWKSGCPNRIPLTSHDN